MDDKSIVICDAVCLAGIELWNMKDNTPQSGMTDLLQLLQVSIHILDIVKVKEEGQLNVFQLQERVEAYPELGVACIVKMAWMLQSVGGDAKRSPVGRGLSSTQGARVAWYRVSESGEKPENAPKSPRETQEDSYSTSGMEK
ncbi:hypothetical protein EDC04DRAFT_2613303 [Pisolithus marmoratus]|nr:hypothetical protein EDC04DRAFT_2613303 [Pisolithus marmoratus]